MQTDDSACGEKGLFTIFTQVMEATCPDHLRLGEGDKRKDLVNAKIASTRNMERLSYH